MKTKSYPIEHARLVSQKVRDRNQTTWDALDREAVMTLDSLISFAELLYQLNQENAKEGEFDNWCKESDDGADEEKEDGHI